MSTQEEETAHCRTPPQRRQIVKEKGDQRRTGRARTQGDPDLKRSSETRTFLCLPSVTRSMQNCNNGIPPGAHALKVDDRLRLARERREEYQKQLVTRELGWLVREERAKHYHETQLNERKRKLEEQRQNEERRRTAVLEKRRQRQTEERERYESVVRRTQEKSQKVKQRPSQRCRRRSLIKSNTNNWVSHHLTLSVWEQKLVSRLTAPTCSSLARSRRATSASRGADSCHPLTAVVCHKSQHRCGSTSRKAGTNSRPVHANARPVNPASLEKEEKESPAARKVLDKQTPSSSNADMRSRSGTSPQCTARAPSPQGARKSIVRRTTPRQVELSSLPEEDQPISAVVLSTSNVHPLMPSVTANDPDEDVTGNPNVDSPEDEKDAPATAEGSSSGHQMEKAPPPGAVARPSAGTRDPEEASRLLAEKRREARRRREKEEERQQRDEEERRGREETAHRTERKPALLDSKEPHRADERKGEEGKTTEEEKTQMMKEELVIFQKQNDAEEARQREKTEQLRKEREKHFQKEEEERQERKKRLDEIMRRTRRSDHADKSASPETFADEAKPKENTEPGQNSTLEQVIQLPVQTKHTKLDLSSMEDMLPIVAFKERRSLRSCAGIDDIQAHQRAEVI